MLKKNVWTPKAKCVERKTQTKLEHFTISESFSNFKGPMLGDTQGGGLALNLAAILDLAHKPPDKFNVGTNFTINRVR